MTDPIDLTLIRSDAGDGGWSLHVGDSDDPEADDLVASGEAEWDEDLGDWDRPNAEDYRAARIAAAGRDAKPWGEVRRELGLD